MPDLLLGLACGPDGSVRPRNRSSITQRTSDRCNLGPASVCCAAEALPVRACIQRGLCKVTRNMHARGLCSSQSVLPSDSSRLPSLSPDRQYHPYGQAHGGSGWAVPAGELAGGGAGEIHRTQPELIRLRFTSLMGTRMFTAPIALRDCS